jgi:hypothetical protein
MRAILHAKFGDHLAKLPHTSDRAPLTSPTPQLHASSVDEDASSVDAFEEALTKAQAAWRASKGRTRTATCSARMVRRP